MGNPIKVKYKFGQIEFEAEGDSYDVEKQRDYFMNAIVPVAKSIVSVIPTSNQETIESPKLQAQLLENSIEEKTNVNFERTNLINYLKPFGNLSDKDFVLFSAYYHENKDNTYPYIFTSETVKSYFSEARRPPAKNNSDLLQRLAKKGLIMEAENPENKIPKPYCITQEGVEYVTKYMPKDDKESTNKRNTTKQKKTESEYQKLTKDSLNLDKYPDISKIERSKDQLLFVMYVIAKEGKGEWFSNNDLDYIITSLFDIKMTKNQISNVFRTKSMFETKKDDLNPKGLKHRLLRKANDHIEKIINDISND